MAKWKRDVILSSFLIVLSIVLFIYAGTFKTSAINIPAAMPDVYMRIWVSILGILSILLLIRTLRKKPDEIVEAMWDKLQVFTVVTLFLYVFSLKYIGYRIATGLFMMLTTTVYCFSDTETRPHGTKAIVLQLAKYLLITVIVVAVSEVLFRYVLSCNLPRFSLF